MRKLRARAGLAALVALATTGQVACGDDDSGIDGDVAADTGGDADADGADVQPEAEVEAEIEAEADAEAEAADDADTEAASGPPTLTALEVRRLEPGIYRLLMTGTDPDGNLSHPQVTFVDAAGTDLPQVGRIDIDVEFAWPYSGETSFEIGTELWVFELVSGDDATPVGATGFRVELLDEDGNESSSLTADWSDMVLRDAGESCSEVAFDDMCSDALVCRGAPAACAARDGAAAAICSGALRELTPGVAATVSGPRHFGGNVFDGSCSPTFDQAWPGPEEVFTLAVPARSRIQVTTSLPASPAADTVLYLRSSCADGATELACTDDDSATDKRSTIDVPSAEPGTYYVFADTYAYSDDFEILATLTPL